MRSRIVNWLVLVAPLAAVIFVWEVALGASARGRFLFGSPSLILDAGIKELEKGEIWLDIGTTALESGLGLLIGTLLGAIAGLCLWLNTRMAVIVRPYIVFIGAVPVFSISPMLIVWFGIGLAPKIAMASFSVFMLVLGRVFQGAQDIDLLHRDWLRGIESPRPLALQEVIIPESLRVVIQAMRVSVGLAFVGAFIGEFMVADRGLGYFILKSGGVYDIPRVVLGVVLFGLMAMLFTFLVDLVGAKLDLDRNSIR
jgi:NitT/TauT family transport system permease protein